MNSLISAAAAQPLYFGTDDVRLFGWLHAAQGVGRAPMGLLLCNPFGFETLHAHRSLAVLASAAAEAGIPAMRFDYLGCGNSSGDEYEPELLGQWVQSVHLAVDELKRRTGVARVCLLGLRLGALLATQAAMTRSDIAGLVAIAPVLQGRQFVREMRALAATASLEPVAGPNGEALVEAGGFFLTAETAQALSSVDVRALQKPPAARVLIVPRDDMPASSSWADALAALGAEVCSEAWSGYAAMMADPQKTQVPHDMIRNIVRTLQSWCSVEVAAAALDAAGSIDALAAEPVSDHDCHYQAGLFRETALQIEANGTRLFGILTVPSAQSAASPQARTASRAGVLLVNQGCVHHIGPSRMWVTLARKWASQGRVVMRVDLSGIGGSAARHGLEPNLAYSPAALDDIGAALHYLQSQCEGGCHLLGMCSGAYHSFQTAVSGRSLLSATIINPLIYSVAEAQSLHVGIRDFELKHISSNYKNKLFSLEPWKKLLSGRLDYRFLWRFLAKHARARVVPLIKKMAEKTGFELATPLSRELRQAAQGGTVLKFVFAEGDDGVDVLHRNAQSLMGTLQSQNRLSVDFVPAADHTFTTFSAREKLLQILDRRIAM